MINGTLTVSLEPPYLSFCDSEGTNYSRYCSKEEIQRVLEDLGNFNWPLRECVVRIPTKINGLGLAKWRLNEGEQGRASRQAG